MYIEFRNYAVDFDARKGQFSCFYADETGKLTAFLRDVRVKKGASLSIITDERAPVEGRLLSAAWKEDALLYIYLLRDGIEFVNGGKTLPALAGIAGRKGDFAVKSSSQDQFLRNASGPFVTADADMLYDRSCDRSLCFDRADKIGLAFDWKRDEYVFDFVLSGRMRFSVREKVCSDLFSLKAWQGISSSHGFATPPVGWMTWYAVRFDACESVVLENARKMKALFGAYAEKMVIWVDWEWCHKALDGLGQPDADALRPRPEAYPRGLKYVSDELKKMGFIPALWSGANNDGTLNELLQKNPGWLMAEAGDWCGRFWPDCSHPEVIDQYFPALFKKILEWGYCIIKFDCWARALFHADEFRDKRFDPGLSSEGAMRKVLKSVRKVIGEDMYFLGCLITDRALQNSTDIFDAARIGNDVFTWEEFRQNAVDRAMTCYPMHNTAWHLDPDTLVLREEYSTPAQARTRVSFVALTGMVFTIGDRLDALDEMRIGLLRRAMPVADIHPVEMVRKQASPDVGVTLTGVSRPWGSWFVAGLYNLTETPQKAVLDFAKAGLPAGRYAVYDFWNRKYLGVKKRRVVFELLPGDCVVLRLTPVEDEVTLISCTKHILQGADELSDIRRNKNSLAGKLRTVAGQETELGFFIPEGLAVKPGKNIFVRKNFAVLKIEPEQSGMTDWKINFIQNKTN